MNDSQLFSLLLPRVSLIDRETDDDASRSDLLSSPLFITLNCCIEFRKKSIDDATYQPVLAQADGPTQDAIQLAYLTGQRPADVLKLARTDIDDGAIKVQQNKMNKRPRIAIEGQLEQLTSRLTQITPKPNKVHSLALICNESGEALTASALRGRFDKAREKAAKIEEEQGQYEFAADVRAFQFRDLRAKAGTDKEEYAGMAATKDQLGRANESMIQKYVRHRKGKLVTPPK